MANASIEDQPDPASFVDGRRIPMVVPKRAPVLR